MAGAAPLYGAWHAASCAAFIRSSSCCLLLADLAVAAPRAAAGIERAVERAVNAGTFAPLPLPLPLSMQLPLSLPLPLLRFRTSAAVAWHAVVAPRIFAGA